MSWKNHPRNITDYQPQDGCAIDAMSLEDAMKDIQDWINNIPERSVKTRWLSHTAVAGWSPASQYSGWDNTANDATGATLTRREYPFLRHLNCNADRIGSFIPTTYMNRQRVKGTDAPGIDSNDEHHFENDNYQLIWTVPISFPAPTVLRSIDLVMRLDEWGAERSGGYSNTFLVDPAGTRGLPRGYSSYDPMRNMSIVVHVDHAVATEKRKLNDSEVAIHNLPTGAGSTYGSADYVLRRRSVSPIPATLASSVWTDMEPSSAGGSLEGIRISEDVNIPIRPGARVRIAIVIPASRIGTGTDPHAGWNGPTPQLLQQWNLSYTWMEALS